MCVSVKYRDLSIRQLHDRRVRGTPVPYRMVRIVPKRPPVCSPQERDYRRIYYGGDHGLVYLQGHRERLLMQRREVLYFSNTQREDRPAGPQTYLRVGGAVSSQPGVRGQRSSSRGGEDVLLQAILNLHKQVDRIGFMSRTVMTSRNTPGQNIIISGSLSPAPPKNCSEAGLVALSPPSLGSEVTGHPAEEDSLKQSFWKNQFMEINDEHKHLSEGSASASASKIFFSDLDEIPGLGEEPEQPKPEDHHTQAINNRALEIEKLYKQDCETFGIVVKMLISKQPALEPMLLSVLHKNLVEIGEKYLEDFKQFISEVNALVKPNQTEP